MKIVFLDASTVGEVGLEGFHALGDFKVYATTEEHEVVDHIGDAEVVITNKVVISREVMEVCRGVRLVCIAENDPLLVLDHDRLFITPHSAWATEESRGRLLDGVRKNIIEYMGRVGEGAQS